MTKPSNVVPIRSDSDYQKTQAFKDRWAEDYHIYQGQPPRGEGKEPQEFKVPVNPDKVNMMYEAIKAWRRATLLTWVVMWGWWR